MTEIENRLRYYLGKLEEPHRTQALSQIDLYFSKHLLDCKLIDNRHNAIKWAFDEPETEVKPKKVKLIEFDYEKYKAGAKAVYRNGDAVQVIVIPERPHKNYPIVSIDNNGEARTHTSKGLYNKSGQSGLDLLLEVEEESEPELFVNVYDNGAVGHIHNTIEEAVKAGESNGQNFTTYKLVKVNQ